MHDTDTSQITENLAKHSNVQNVDDTTLPI